MSPTGTAKKTFEKLSPRAFEHPLDRTAISALQKVPGIDWIAKKFLTAIGEKRLRLVFLASAVRVSDKQFPRIKKLFDEACDVLDIEDRPELFVAQNFFVNAAAVGVDKPLIVVTSALTDMMDDDELQCVLAHELGHVMCGHALYTTLLILMVNLWYLFLGIPGGLYAVIAIRLALLEWSRKAELSADRAGLLVSQDPMVSYRVDMKLAGGRKSDEMSVEAFFEQAAEYEAHGDLLDGVLKLVNLMGQTHPFPVLRVSELKKWVDAGDYDAIMNGDYARRDGDAGSRWIDGVKSAVAGYKESLDDSTDPLLSTLRDLGGGAAATGAGVLDFLKRVAGVGEPEDETSDKNDV